MTKDQLSRSQVQKGQWPGFPSFNNTCSWLSGESGMTHMQMWLLVRLYAETSAVVVSCQPSLVRRGAVEGSGVDVL